MINRQFVIIVASIIAVWCTGIAGYIIIEDWNFLDSIYMTTVSLTTVGYKETRPLSDHGRIFTMVLITVGMGLFFYSLSKMTESIFNGHIKGLFEKKRMDKIISRLSDHYIVCGYGRIGQIVCRELIKASLDVVVIEKDPLVLEQLKKEKMLFIGEDATSDETLLKAGIMRARNIISLLHTDEANVYIVLSSRYLNKKIKITSRADSPSSEKKIKQAGANEVIQPYEIGAKKIALTVLKPNVLEFIDLAVHSAELNLAIEQIKIEQGSQLENVTLGGFSLREKTGVTLLAVKRGDNKMYNIISPDFLLKPDDIIIVLGSKTDIEKTKTFATP
jgi:voltage-gated potassium channel